MSIVYALTNYFDDPSQGYDELVVSEQELNNSTVNIIESGSFSHGSDSGKIDSKIQERSFLPGAVPLGDKREESRSMDFVFDIVGNETNSFRDIVNDYLRWFKSFKHITDKENELRILYQYDSYSIEYDAAQGTLHKSGKVIIKVVLLDPFWEEVDVSAGSGNVVFGVATAGTINTVVVTTNSPIDTYPIIRLIGNNTAAMGLVDIWRESNNQGISVDDPIAGIAPFEQMTINNIRGKVYIGPNTVGSDAILEKNNNIVPGTGFITLPYEADTINIRPADTNVTYVIYWRKRYFI